MSQSQFDSYEHLHISLNPDGSLTRFITLPSTPASGEDAESSGLQAVSKDVVLDARKKTWIRIYRPSKLPSNDSAVAKLPIVIYLHGGGWIQMSIASTAVHESLNQLCSDLPAIVIGVEYRLAPESRLPAQYEDATDTLIWVKNQALNADGDKWFRDFGDFSRCYLYGSSCGANIAFNAALRAIDMKLEPVSIKGLILNQPLFGGKKRTKSELKLATDPYFPLPVIDLLWELALPHGTDRDHRFCNPLIHGPYKEKIKHLSKFLVIGFGGDPLIDRQQEFVQMLVLNGVLVEARFDDIGFHGIEMIDSRRAAAIFNFVKEFVI